MDKNYIDDLTQSIYIGGWKKKLKDSTFLLTLIIPFIFSLIYFSFYISGNGVMPKSIGWIMFILVVPLITISLYISQKKSLVGDYGETIMILIPTFVWLLAGHVVAMKWLIAMSFAIMIIGLISFFSGFLMRKRINPSNRRVEVRKLLIRIGFVASSTVSTVVVSFALLNWGDGSVHLADQGGIKNYTKNSWIIFVALVTVITALILVSLGLITHYEKIHIKKNKISFFQVNKTTKFMNQTISIKVNKKSSYKKSLFKRIFGRR